MKNSKISLIIALLFFSFVLVNCGGGDTATEENTEAVEDTAENTEEASSEEETADAEEAPVEETQNIVALAQGNEGLSTLVEALVAAELVDALNGDGPFTVFAPTNEAFAALGETLTQLMEAEDKTELANILKYHVVSGKFMSGDLSDGMEAETLQGAKIKVAIGEGVKLNDAANVTTADVEASNGVVHIIDAVITPPAE